MRAITATALCLSIVGLATAAAADASIRKAISIPSQGLGAALKSVAHDLDVHLVFVQEDVSSLRTSGASGNLTVDEALQQILRGTGLTYRQLDEKTLAIVPVAAAGAGGSGDTVSSVRDELEEVIVTANKRREKIQDVAASITVLNGEQIDRLHATSIQEFANYVPGLFIEGGVNPGMQGIALRGLAATGNRAMVGTYIDETPVGSEAAISFDSSMQFDMMPYDLDRVEVLRGPQGTLYGASSMGGIIKYVTRGPDLDNFDSRAGAETFMAKGADDLGYALRGAVNVPLIQGKLAVRASVSDKETPGFIDNYLTGEKDQNELSQYGGRVIMLWQASDSLAVKASVTSQRTLADENSIIRLNAPRSPTTGIYTPLGPIGGDLTNGNLVSEPLDKELKLYNVTLDWDLGWAHALSVSSYANNDMALVMEQSQFIQQIFPGRLMGMDLDIEDQRYTQELRLASPAGERFEWMVGAYYNKQKSDFLQLLILREANGSLVEGFNPLVTVTAPTTYREIASFANVTYRFTSAFDLSLGLRWASNEQTYHQVSVPHPVMWFVARTDHQQRSDESVVTYAVTPRYYLSKDTMLYASVSNGYRPGGPNVFSPNQPEIPTQVDADTITNYETGFKSDFLDGRAMIQLALFRMEWDDIQISASGGTGFSYNINGGTARSQGVELATGFSPVKGLRFNVTTAYTDAELTEDVPAQRWKSGYSLRATPTWSGSFTASYEFPAFGAWDSRVSGGWRYVGERTPDVDRGDGQYKLDAYSAVDANLGLSRGPWELSLYARNLADNRVYIARGPIGSVFSGTALQPRRVGLSVDYKF